MKTILFLIFSAFSISVFSQIQQNVNKSTGTVTKPITQIDSIRFNTSTNQMEIIQTNGNADNHTISDVINVTFSGQLLGTISTLDCSSANNTGSLTAYSAASGVSSTISYTGGNGGVYNGQTVTSTGVIGLTATLTAGAFAVGAGTLTYNITGTPNSSGTASFLLNIGGKTCTLTWTVVLPIGSVSFLNCGNATNTGTLIDGTTASGVSSNIPYTGGNGGTHNGQIVNSTGVTGLTATLNPGTFAVGSGSLTYNITGTPNGNGTASFLLNIGGKSCTLTINVELPAGTISLLDCANTINTGSLIAYSAVNGVSSSIPYSGGNSGTYSSQSIPSTGVTGLTADLNAGILSNGNGTLNFIISGTPSGDGIATFLVDVGGQSCSLTWTVNLPIGEITGSLDCGSATNTGTLTAYETANGVNSSISYYGGNGGTYNGQTVTSTGVTGLTASLSAGVFALGNGNLTYSISGIPSSDGIATFLIEIGGQICYLDIPVNLPVGTITVLSCGLATNTGVLAEGVLASGVSSSIAYSGGNGGTYSGQTVASTGVIGLTATLATGTFANGTGNLVYTITGTPASPGTASFSLNIGGQTCLLTRTVNLPIGTITALSCGIASNTGTLTSGVLANDVSSSIPYIGGNGGTHNGQTVTSTGVTGLTATLSAGTFALGNGNLNYSISGTPSSGGTASFALNIGGQSCTLTITIVFPVASLTSLNCGSATNTGTLIVSTAASGVSTSIPYSGSNGGTYNAQSVSSTGVSGLTANLSAGTLLIGSGNITYTITGTPTASGTASFAISLGGQNCIFNVTVNTLISQYSPNSVFCAAGPTAIVNVTNPTTGKVWMDRNLGATQVATSSSDASSYGDLYQWGRRSDGHQCRNSAITATQVEQSTVIQPPHGKFITTWASTPCDWLSPSNTNLWGVLSGINNPCPSGYRIPTEPELFAERASWSTNNAAGAFASPLKLPLAGFRGPSNGSIVQLGAIGFYWSSTANNDKPRYLHIESGLATTIYKYCQAGGLSVRCIKN